jgi:hypothetical protein
MALMGRIEGTTKQADALALTERRQFQHQGLIWPEPRT